MNQVSKNTVNLKVKMNWRLRLTLLKIRIYGWFRPSKAIKMFDKIKFQIEEDATSFFTVKGE